MIVGPNLSGGDHSSSQNIGGEASTEALQSFIARDSHEALPRILVSVAICLHSYLSNAKDAVNMICIWYHFLPSPLRSGSILQRQTTHSNTLPLPRSGLK